ncbi:MAG: hypothetical protein K0B02_02380 [DPANN group archaeon]|nr:hypothetical protein [DPANN group archaeon]
MPFTPFHIGYALLIGLILLKNLDIFVFFIASVIIDIEPFMVLVMGLDYPLHGFFHSFLGGSIVAVFLIFLMSVLLKKYSFFNFVNSENYIISSKKVWFASFFGIYLHIFFDSILYLDIKPFSPLSYNPFYGVVSMSNIYLVCTISLILGLCLFLYKRYLV